MSLVALPTSPSSAIDPTPRSGRSRIRQLRTWIPVHRAPLTMVGLSILLAELLTGSTPVLGLLNPLGDLFLLGLYGCGVLAIRDVGVRWNRGWGSVLLLGTAYGIAEEGLGTKTFFDPALIGSPNFGPWTHALGVNWVWASELAVFHAVFSIMLPIVITGLLYPESRRSCFLTDRGVKLAFASFGVTVGAMFFLFTPGYPLSATLILGCLGAMSLLALAARVVPARWTTPRASLSIASPRRFFLVGLAFTTGFIGVNTVGAWVLRDPFLTVALSLLWTWVMGRWVLAHLGPEGPEYRLTALIGGMMAFEFCFVLVVGMLLGGDVGAPIAVLLGLWVLWKLHGRYHPESRGVSPASPSSRPNSPSGPLDGAVAEGPVRAPAVSLLR